VTDETDLVAYRLLPDDRTLGPRFGPLFPRLREALQSMDAAAAVRTLQAGLPVKLTVDEREIELASGEIVIRTTPRPGSPSRISPS